VGRGQIRATKTLIREISSHNSSQADWEQMRSPEPVCNIQRVSHDDFIRLLKHRQNDHIKEAKRLISPALFDPDVGTRPVLLGP
jgi:hypothetical protein